ncbi:Inner membrane protein YhiM [Nonomuraea coxensis DSM 45129]|uniref:Inner membrane protein YhiM n=1 Tax=Nonomuraea coxensis DSM 45129 TaxID=1122611 RepID=A0ABX8TTI4_9ACTN|nr:DUF2776 family protein [Nonomuraea coxensis]QYC38780.1 Inner membrane protein YhiM [Nonomuraea coxensis DSM 45129]
MSVVFRAIPLVMGVICGAFGWYVLAGAPDADHFVAGHVTIALAAICYALFTTAATIIRQLISRYSRAWQVILPLTGYLSALIAVVYGVVILTRGDEPPYVVAGHVIVGIGLISACVSTVATSSTRFTLIPVNAARTAEDEPPEEAYSPVVGKVLIAVPALCALAGFVYAFVLMAKGGGTTPEGGAYYTAGHVLFGLSAICASLIALVASIVRQVRNSFGEPERYRWGWLVIVMGTIDILLGVYVLASSDHPYRIAPGCILIGLGLVCYSILSKALLLALVWRRTFPLANRIPMIPVVTALTCLFFGAFLFEAAVTDPSFFIPARVLVGLGAVCFTLFSIVSILEEGTSG